MERWRRNRRLKDGEWRRNRRLKGSEWSRAFMGEEWMAGARLGIGGIGDGCRMEDVNRRREGSGKLAEGERLESGGDRGRKPFFAQRDVPDGCHDQHDASQSASPRNASSRAACRPLGFTRAAFVYTRRVMGHS